ncbi:MAG TPA: MFS transporter [Myxococcota bacterium]|nr:MFS transporter [Myxococcota bacterium]
MDLLSECDARRRRDLRAILCDGIAFSAMMGLGESYFAAFVLAAGFGDIAAGLVTTLPLVAGAVLQLVTPAGVRLLGSHRRWVVTCAVLQATTFAPLSVGALLGRIPYGVILLAATAYWGFGMATGPAWNTWVGTLVPPPLRARFFAHRTRWSHAALFTALVAAGALLHRTHPTSGALASFALLFALAAAARLVSAALLASQSEQRPLIDQQQSVSIRAFVGRLRRSADGALLAQLLAMQLAVYIASPYFTPYMLKELELSYGLFTTLIAAAFAGRILLLPALGRIAYLHGARRLLVWSACGVTPIPALWLLSSHPAYLFALQIVAGFAWGGLELATLMLFFERIDASERTGVLTCFNLVNASALALGSLVGAGVFYGSGGGTGSYWLILSLSSFARLSTLPLLRKIPAEVTHSAAPTLRTLAVRPSAGALQRPILASVPDANAPPAKPAETDTGAPPVG